MVKLGGEQPPNLTSIHIREMETPFEKTGLRKHNWIFKKKRLVMVRTDNCKMPNCTND